MDIQLLDESFAILSVNEGSDIVFLYPWELDAGTCDGRADFL